MASKRKHLMLQEKVEIIEAWNKSFGSSTKVQFAKKFDLPESTLKGILANKEKILEGARNYGLTSKRQKIQGGRSEEFDKALLQWFNEVRALNTPISGVIFKENALILAEKFGLENFQASSGWLTKFKERYGLTFKSICGESGSVDEKKVEEWKSELEMILDGYDKKNIFNADETGLFYNMMPNKTLTYKKEKCFGGKHSKERLTVLLCCNSDGSEKFPLLVIGKPKQPRCFKNIKRKPCEYKNNTKSWMTSLIFIDWIKKFDAKMRKEKRKSLLLIDRCPAHPPISGLTNVSVHFLPANCTSKLQPLDLGIIRSVKANYRKSLIRKLILNIADKKDIKKMTILDAMHMISSAWRDVSPYTIQKCFRAAGIGIQEQLDTENVQLDTENITTEEWKSVFGEGNASIQDFVECDEDVLTTEFRNLDEIYEDITNENTASDVEDDDEEIPTPSYSDANSALDILRRYIVSSNMEDDSFNLLDKLEARVLKTRPPLKQSTLFDFLKT